MPTLSDLLSDTGAQIELIVSGTYLDELNISRTEWISQTGWDDPVGGEVGTYIPPLLTSRLRITAQVDPLQLVSSFATFGDIELSNNHLDYAGRYDGWWRYAVDGQAWTLYAVGTLSDGTRVELSDVIDTPLFELKGINIPEIGSDTCLIRTRDVNSLDTALQTITYSPPALYFPGTVAGALSLGNNINITGVQSISVWVYVENITTAQYIAHKDSGTTGYYLAYGLVGGGTIVGGVEIGVRGQTPLVTTTAANVIRAFRWHRVDISIDTTTRRIDIDGVTAVTTSGITGTPTTSSTTLTIGRSLLGLISRLLWWSDARSNANMAVEGRTPITGAETNLREAFLFAEGKGTTTASSKSGSSLTATLGTGTLWDTASWHYESILGQYEPYVLGTVLRAPVTWVDPPKQIGQVSRGPIALLSELQSNHSTVSAANYTVNNTNGTLTVTTGALSGTYSATVTANNLWNSALLFNGSTSSATATITMPAASKYIGAHFRNDLTSASNQHLAGWVAGGSAAFWMRTLNGILSVNARNDAGSLFTAQITIAERRQYSALCSLDTANPTTGLKLYLNGVLVATTAITGNWTTTQTAFAVGRRSGLNDWFTGRIDEVVIGNTAATLSMAETFHAIPSTPAMTGIFGGWHFNEATGTTAAPFVGAVSLTLASVTWTAGRSAPTDLARSVFYHYGLAESGLDAASWLEALNDNVADCGWFVTAGAKGIEVLNNILGGLGFVLYKAPGSAIKIKRFEGLSGSPSAILDPETDLQSQPVEASPADPAVYQWIIQFAINNSKQDQANVAGGLASTDPDRYQYGAAPFKSISRSDGVILDRLPDAETRSKTTALLNLLDATNEASRLLAIHRHGADRKTVQAFLAIGQLEPLQEIGPLFEEVDLDEGTTIVTGFTIEDGVGTISVWRPSI